MLTSDEMCTLRIPEACGSIVQSSIAFRPSERNGTVARSDL